MTNPVQSEAMMMEPFRRGMAGEINANFIGHWKEGTAMRFGTISFLTKDIALRGHAGRQSPMPSHKDSLTSLALPFTILNAPSWHALTHNPHPSHEFSSIWIVLRIMMMYHSHVKSIFSLYMTEPLHM